MFRSWGSLLWMVGLFRPPAAAGPGDGHEPPPIVRVEGGSAYSIGNLSKLWSDAALQIAGDAWEDMGAMGAFDARKPPGVPTWIMHGSGQDTPVSYTFPAGMAGWDEKPTHVEYANGDNTATIEGLTGLPLLWR